MSQIKNAQIRYRIIDRCLRNQYNPYPSKRKLREACEEALYGSIEGENICDSTIEKDLFSMRMDHDAPIKYSKANLGYFYEDEDYSIDSIPLTKEDIQAIQFATKTLMQFKEVALFKQFGNAIDKIVDRVHVATSSKADEYQEIIQFETGVASSGNEHLTLFLESIQEQQLVTFTYTSYITGKPKNRIVLPLLLKEYRNRWYLISQDSEKNKVVTYALERMDEVVVSDKVSDKPKDFNPDSFFQHSVGITANESEPLKVVLKANNIAAKYIQSQPFHLSQKLIKEGNKRSTFTLSVIITEELIRDLMSYGGEIEVIEPSILRESILLRVQEMKKIYSV
ncbi:MAG: WYL domain-containing protein [Bacteroidetes bacterium]|nr:WYL domain-containing protein [Bacteroidota bacterium]